VLKSYKNNAFLLTNKKTLAVSYNAIKHDGHLKTWGKFRKHEPAARVFYISRVFSNVPSVLLQRECDARLRLLHFLYNIEVTWRKPIKHTLSMFYLRNRKHAPCFYRVIETRVEVWENEKCCGNTSRKRAFPQLFRVLPNFHECF